MGNIKRSSQFRIMTYLYVDDKLHIITPRSNAEGSQKENLWCPRYENDMTDYIIITEVSLFNKVPKYYVEYFDAFGFMVGNLVVTYHPTGHKRDPSGDDRVQPLPQLTGTRSRRIED